MTELVDQFTGNVLFREMLPHSCLPRHMLRVLDELFEIYSRLLIIEGDCEVSPHVWTLFGNTISTGADVVCSSGCCKMSLEEKGRSRMDVISSGMLTTTHFMITRFAWSKIRSLYSFFIENHTVYRANGNYHKNDIAADTWMKDALNHIGPICTSQDAVFGSIAKVLGLKCVRFSVNRVRHFGRQGVHVREAQFIASGAEKITLDIFEEDGNPI
ncbi:MAG: hypothetical protein ACE5HE_00175 [Phycisphaerae bacterium]